MYWSGDVGVRFWLSLHVVGVPNRNQSFSISLKNGNNFQILAQPTQNSLVSERCRNFSVAEFRVITRDRCYLEWSRKTDVNCWIVITRESRLITRCFSGIMITREHVWLLGWSAVTDVDRCSSWSRVTYVIWSDHAWMLFIVIRRDCCWLLNRGQAWLTRDHCFPALEIFLHDSKTASCGRIRTSDPQFGAQESGSYNIF